MSHTAHEQSLAVQKPPAGAVFLATASQHRSKHQHRHPTKNLSWLNRLGGLGAILSLLCAVHCMVMPLFVGLFAGFGGAFELDERIEHGIMLSSFAIAAINLATGYRRHGRRRVLVLFTIALGVFALGETGASIAEHAHYLSAAGGIILAFALFANRHGKACKHSHE